MAGGRRAVLEAGRGGRANRAEDGDALETLRALPAEPAFDFAFVDADKEGYPAYYEQLLPRMTTGGLIALDNVFQGGRVFDPAFQEPRHTAIREINEIVAADDRVESVMLSVSDGLTLIRKR